MVGNDSRVIAPDDSHFNDNEKPRKDRYLSASRGQFRCAEALRASC